MFIIVAIVVIITTYTSSSVGRDVGLGKELQCSL